MKHKLTVVIVSYNVRYYLEQCISSVLRATSTLDAEVFVVDNHSADDTVAYLHQRFGDTIRLIESPHNLGFARANNIAIRQTDSDYVLLLNPDTIVGEDAITTVVNFLDAHPEGGGAGVMMLNADGTVARESRRALPTPWVSFLKMLGFSRRYYMSHLPWDTPGQIDVVSGAFFMLRREALNTVGLLDEDFFMYGEDIDLSYRLQKGGYTNWYIPARILHYKGESTHKSSYRYVHIFYQAMLIFFRKHYGHLSFLVTWPIKLAIYGRAFIALMQMLYWRMRTSLGFYGKRAAETSYLLRGSDDMIARCTALAAQKGFTVTTDTTQSPLCVVYDTDTCSFEQIFNMARTASPAMIGTYSTTNNILITQRDIIR